MKGKRGISIKVDIIGAGLSCSVILAAKGIEVEIFESDATVGGMTKSFELWGQRGILDRTAFSVQIKE